MTIREIPTKHFIVPLRECRFGELANIKAGWTSRNAVIGGRKAALWVIRYRFGARRKSLHVRNALKADAKTSVEKVHLSAHRHALAFIKLAFVRIWLRAYGFTH